MDLSMSPSMSIPPKEHNNDLMQPSPVEIGSSKPAIRSRLSVTPATDKKGKKKLLQKGVSFIDSEQNLLANSATKIRE